MWRYCLSAFAGIVVWVSSQAQAATVVNTSGGYVSGITGLIIAGSEYDVTFSGQAFNSLYGTGSLSLPANLAAEAGNAIATAINATGVYKLSGYLDPGGVTYYFFVPYFTTDVTVWAKVWLNGTLSGLGPFEYLAADPWILHRGTSQSGESGKFQYAVFTPTLAPAPVPLPPALILFATVLAGGGLIAWRRRWKAANLAV